MRPNGLAVGCVLAGLLLGGCGDAESEADDLFARGSAQIAAGDYTAGVAVMRQIVDRYPDSRAAANVRKDWPYYEELLAIEAERLPVLAAEDLRVIGKAVERYRARNGRYPVDPQALVPLELERLPVDPWGRPYRYRLEGGSYVVETLGRDGNPGGTGEDRDMRVERGQLRNAPRVRPPREEAPTR